MRQDFFFSFKQIVSLHTLWPHFQCIYTTVGGCIFDCGTTRVKNSKQSSEASKAIFFLFLHRYWYCFFFSICSQERRAASDIQDEHKHAHRETRGRTCKKTWRRGHTDTLIMLPLVTVEVSFNRQADRRDNLKLHLSLQVRQTVTVCRMEWTHQVEEETDASTGTSLADGL